MTHEEQFNRCLQQAKLIVKTYRTQCPITMDPKAWYVSTTLVVLAIVSAAVGAYGAVSSGQAQHDAASFNAKVATNNAQAQAQQAQYEADRIRTRNRAMLGQARASFAKSGVSIEDGSASDVLMDSSIQGELDVAAAIYTGRVGAGASVSQARLYGMQGRNAQTSGYISAGSSILSGASSATRYGSNPDFNV